MGLSADPANILVVEDDHAIRLALSELLIDEGYSVHEAPHGQAALEYLRRAPALPCLILLDLMMPTMTGWEFRSQQRQDASLRDIPVVVLSALGHRLDPAEKHDLAAVEYLSKPIDWVGLTGVVQRWCSPDPS